MANAIPTISTAVSIDLAAVVGEAQVRDAAGIMPPMDTHLTRSGILHPLWDNICCERIAFYVVFNPTRAQLRRSFAHEKIETPSGRVSTLDA